MTTSASENTASIAPSKPFLAWPSAATKPPATVPAHSAPSESSKNAAWMPHQMNSAPTPSAIARRLCTPQIGGELFSPLR